MSTTILLLTFICLRPLGVFAQDLYVDFENHPNGTYTEEQIVQDFGMGYLFNNPGDRLRVVSEEGVQGSKALRLTFNQGEVGATNSGGQFFGLLPPRQEYVLDYYIRFDENFDFRLGGKIPGLSGGESNAGGNQPSGDGWSARYNWRENGRVVLYLYHLDQPTRFGEDLDLNRRFVPGQWHRLTQRIRVNSGNNPDGQIQVWFDGELVLLRSDIRFRDNGRAPVDHFFFSTFHGGNTTDWAPQNKGYAYFDNIHIATSTNNLSGLEPGQVLAVLNAPSQGAVYEKGARVKLTASATALQGTVEKVIFYNGEQMLGESTAPFEWVIDDATPGTYGFAVQAFANGVASARSNVREVIVEPENPAKGKNLAQGKGVRVSSAQAGNPGSAAVDGSTENEDRWSAQGFPQVLTVDLGTALFINNIEVAPYRSRAYQYEIALSEDGQAFNRVVDNRSNNQEQPQIEHTFARARARYVRLRVVGASGYTGDWVSIKEFRIFDTATAGPVPGDLTGDGRISALDASRLLMHLTGINALNNQLQAIADVSGEGVLDQYDVQLILKRTAGLISCFPVQEGCSEGQLNL